MARGREEGSQKEGRRGGRMGNVWRERVGLGVRRGKGEKRSRKVDRTVRERGRQRTISHCTPHPATYVDTSGTYTPYAQVLSMRLVQGLGWFCYARRSAFRCWLRRLVRRRVREFCDARAGFAIHSGLVNLGLNHQPKTQNRKPFCASHLVSLGLNPNP